METQESITRWADDTFGPKHPAEVAARMNVEVAELVAGLATVAAVPVADMDRELVRALQKECADVFIMLAQVAEKLNVDLQTVVNYKMSVNRNRSWGRSPTGKMQHVETLSTDGITAGAQDAVVPTFRAGGFFEGQDGVNIYLGRELRAGEPA